MRIKYTNEYKQEKQIKQYNLNYLKLCSCIVILITLSTLTFLAYYNYFNSKSVSDLKNVAQKDIRPKEKKEEQVVNEDTNIETNEEEIINSTPLTEDYEALRSINPDTVGWIKINNTSVDYPVVKGSDNDYYLKRSFYKKVNGAGWIYMDYRNDIDNMDKNTIIYGHNMRGSSKLMFTTLEKYAKKESWYSKKENQIITFNTVNQNMNWQIFSIYVAESDTNVDNYIKTKFLNDNEYQEFLNSQKSKSIYDFGIEVTSDNNILTLTTCTEKGTKRLVIHAKLIK